jgi:hypothetical protein
VATVYRWHTRTGLRFVPESREEWNARCGKRGESQRAAVRRAADDAQSIVALCEVVERITAAREAVTERALSAVAEPSPGGP